MKKQYFAWILAAFLFSLAISYGVRTSNSTIRVKKYSDFNVSNTLGYDFQIPDINLSDYYDLSGGQVYIDDADPNYNWSKTVAENEWCSGSGTWSDPYVIEKVYIDGNFNIAPIPGIDYSFYSTSCINIRNTDAYFAIRNCFLTRSGDQVSRAGIMLSWAQNGKIYLNLITYCYYGIHVYEESHNATIVGNFILNPDNLYGNMGGHRAIELGYSFNGTVALNYINNYRDGISLDQAHHTIVRINLVNNSVLGFLSDNGVILHKVNRTSVIRNILAGDLAGGIQTFKVDQVDCSDNTFENNTVTGTLPSTSTSGIRSSGEYNTLFSLEDCHYNYIAHNIFYIPGYTEEAAIPSYDMLIIISTLGILSLLFAVKKRTIRIKD